MQKNIYVHVKNVYGNDLVYPSCETGKLLASLLEVKTFNARQLETIRKLGYTVENAYAMATSLVS